MHGTPITVRADDEGVDPQVIVDRYHGEFLAQWDLLGFDWDLYTSTGTPNHHAVTQDMFLKLYQNGHIDKRTSDQFYDPVAERFLPDRYVEGTCPHCGYEHARGDQCENCGRTLDSTDLIRPTSRMSGATPEVRSTEHFYFRLSEFSDRLEEWLRSRQGWRKHVLNFSLGWIEEGLQDRPITRDIEWGVEIPIDDLGPGKRIYVWFDAVIGYLSAAKEWAQIEGDPDAWRLWWENPEAEHFYFMAKDNVPFHTIIWPAMLMGYQGLELPTDVPANQHVTFRGSKASSSRGVGMTIGEALGRFEPDALRYAVAKNFPETNDTDLSVEEIARSINEELVATWGNLVNRVVSMTHRYFEGVVPDPGDSTEADDAILAEVDETMDEVAALISAVKLRAGLAAAMGAAQAVNGYLSEEQPWKTAKTDPGRTGTILYAALSAIAGIATALAPYLPVTSVAVLEMVGCPVTERAPAWTRPAIAAGTELGPAEPLFAKVELAAEVD